MEGLEFNETHQLMFYADNVNIVGEKGHTVRRNRGALLEAGK
jgi:hypothetical protein